jgi:hypothetical protein
MIVVHFAKVSTLYPRVVISSLAKRLEKPPFCESVSLLGCLNPIEHWVAIGSSQPMQESPGVDPMAEAAGSGRGWRRLMLVAVCHGRAWWLAGVQVFSSYGGQFSMRFAPTESQQ